MEENILGKLWSACCWPHLLHYFPFARTKNLHKVYLPNSVVILTQDVTDQHKYLHIKHEN